MTATEKNLLLDRLSVCYNRTNYLKIVCEENKALDEAAQFDRRKARLRIEIDGLLRDLYHNWIGDAQTLKGKLDDSNRALDKCISNIEADIKTAENIVKAIGYVDNIIKVAVDLVA